jgi:hypothetical protein
VRIPVEPTHDGTLLPDGVQLDRGTLCVEFADAADLLRKLYGIAQAAAADFEAFRAAAENVSSPASALGPGPPA